MFSLEFDNLFSTIDFESFESKENETLTEINNTNNTTYTASERPALTETTKSFMHFVIDTINWFVSYNSGVIALDYSLNCTPLSPITYTYLYLQLLSLNSALVRVVSSNSASVSSNSTLVSLNITDSKVVSSH